MFTSSDNRKILLNEGSNKADNAYCIALISTTSVNDGYGLYAFKHIKENSIIGNGFTFIGGTITGISAISHYYDSLELVGLQSGTTYYVNIISIN